MLRKGRLELAEDEKKKEMELTAEQRKIKVKAELKRLEIKTKPYIYQKAIARTNVGKPKLPTLTLAVDQIDI